MARTQGDLGLLTVVTIFVVVLSLMYGGVQYSRGELGLDEGLSARETQLRTELSAAIDERRADRGLDPLDTHTYHAHRAQDTARRLAAEGYFEGRGDAGPDDPGERTLPNELTLCDQLAVKLTVTDPEWTDSGGQLPPGTAEAVADRLAARMTASERAGVLYRDGAYADRVGLVVEENAVYAVYRSCVLTTD